MQPYTPSRSDRVGIWIFLIAGVVIAVWTTVAATLRVIEVVLNRDVPVLGEFAGTPASAPIGPDGASVTVGLQEATLTVSGLPPAAVIALVLQQLALVLTVVTIVSCLSLLARSIFTGTLFGKANTRLVSTAGIVGLVGFAAVPFFGNMGANAAFARVSDGTFDNVVISIDPFPFILGAFAVSLTATVFVVGERLQRDAEGLV